MTRHEDSVTDRMALVTGATGTIGFAIARELAREPGFGVVLAARDAPRCEEAAKAIGQEATDSAVSWEQVDVSRYESIRALVERWTGPLHVLINNAAAVPRARQETPEGIEVQFATNVLGYFWMISEFSELLASSSPARVINVASYWAGGLDVTDLQFRRRGYDNGTAYRQSKQANRMLTVSFAERLAPLGITVNACHPGDARSKLSEGLGFGGHATPEEAAATPVWLARGEVGGDKTGRYFAHLQEEPDEFAGDSSFVEELHRICESYTPPPARP